MKKLVFFIGILILSLGCSSEPEISVKDITTTANSGKSDQSSDSQEKLPLTPTADKLELAAICSFDSSVPKISCQASGTTANGSQLRWESNASGWNTGKSYEFKLIEPHQLVSPVYVTLEECRGSSCKTVEVSLDTSSIVPESSKDDSKTNNGEEQKKTVESLPTTPVNGKEIHPGLEGCVERDSVLFTHHATDLDFVSGIYPSIVTSGNWLKPNSYVWIDQDAPIYAPSDATNVGLLRWIQYYQDESGAHQERLQFNVRLQISCDIRIYFGHVEDLVEPFASLVPTEAAINSTHIGYYAFVPMEIKAGTLLGYARYRNLSGAADNFDFVMSNNKKVNQFANQDRYLIQGDLENLLRAECPFDYYPALMRKEWSSQFGGYQDERPIGYDCDMSPDKVGTIAGGWFQTPHDPDTDGKTIIDWGLSIRIKSDGNLNIGHPNGTLKVYSNDPTFRDPKTVVDASCFYDRSSKKFGFLKPIGDMDMEVAFGNGDCPSEMPANSEIFYR
jgi:hypothetical protein